MNYLYVLHRPRKGRCVIADRAIPANITIAHEHVLLFPNGDARRSGVVHRYTFAWDERTSAISLGIGSLLSHSYDPNVVYRFLPHFQAIAFYTRRRVRQCEELTINYNGDPDDKSPVGFRVSK